jgi:antitoxin component of RelBE/YafQ-DinJ toxin-antitoxin module
LEFLKTDILFRLMNLAYAVQNEEQHRMFKPGEIWWVSSLGDGGSVTPKYPEALHICDQLGITVSDMKKAFGKRWTANKQTPFNFFRHRKLGNVNFISVELINEFSDYGSDSLGPHYDEKNFQKNSVANKKMHSTALGRLAKQICTSSSLMRPSFLKTANNHKKEYTAVMKKNETVTKEKHSAVIPSEENPSAAIPSEDNHSAAVPSAAANEAVPPASLTPPDPVEEAPPVLIPSAAFEQVGNDNQPELSLSQILAYVKNLRKDKNKCEQEDVRKQSSHIAYELVAMLKDSDDRVFLRSERARGSSWRKEVESRGGNSERSIQRVSKTIREAQSKCTSKMSKEARQKSLTKANKVVARYKRFKRDLIVLDRDDHLSLLSAGGMTDRQMLAFGRRFAKLTGIVFHNSGNTLAKSTANLVPDCTISKVKVAIKGQEVERQSLQVDRLTDVISHRIVSLYENKVLKKSSDMTLLDDDTLIIRFGGDKGGTFMQFKYGITVMNCHSPNGADAFDICMTLDAPDTYSNLQTLFESKESEHEFYFNLETPPSFGMLETEDNQVLCEIMFNVAGDSTIESFEATWANREEVELDMNDHKSSAGVHSSGPYSINSETKLQVLVESGTAWGIRLSDEIVLRYRSAIPISKLNQVNCKAYKLHCVLGGDIAFINMVVGLQGCSASYPCYLCEVLLATLKKREMTMTAGERRTWRRAEAQIKDVLLKKSAKDQKKAAKTNASFIRKPLIPVDFSRILLAPLHIILGVVKKLWDELVFEVQAVDTTIDKQRKELEIVRDAVARIVAYLEAEIERDETELEEANEAKTSAYEALNEVRNSPNVDYSVEEPHRTYHQATCKAVKELQAKKKSREGDKLGALKKELKDINTYLQTRRGRYEQTLERLIGQPPINAKHNPFYGGSFNGNDCFRLLQNYGLIVDSLRDAASDTPEEERGKINDISNRYEQILGAFSRIAPSFRAARLLSSAERASLLDDIQEFWEGYISHSDGSVTIKIHQLVHHFKEMLERYGTIGLFAEDGMESIHAVVNRLARQYASLDPKRRATQIIRQTAGRKRTSTLREKEIMEQKGEQNKKRQRIQGERKAPLVLAVVKKEHTDPVKLATEEALDGFFTAAPHFRNEEQGEEQIITFPDFELVACEKCRHFTSEDTLVPALLYKLHCLVTHSEIDDRMA